MSPPPNAPWSPRKIGETAALVLLLAALPHSGTVTGAPAAGAPAGEPPTFSEILDVRLVEVDVVVTRGGKPVSGLQPDDFVLRVDGEPRPVEFFSEIASGLTVAASESGSGETGLAAAPIPGEAAATRYLVFIDDYFAVPSHRDRVLLEMSRQLDRLDPRDEMAIVAYDGRRIEVLAGWTSSRSRLADALVAATERTAFGLRRMSEQSRTGLPNDRAPGGNIVPGQRSGPRASFSSIGFLGSLRDGVGPRGDEGSLRRQMGQLARAAASSLRGFAAPRSGARQVALLLAGGWPAPSRERVGGTPSRQLSPQIRFRPFEPLLETANRLGYTLYPVDLYAAGGDAGRDVEVGTFNEARRAAAWHERHVAEGRDVLVHLAGATGGRAIVGPARLVALEQVSDDVRSYYRLGFNPDWRGDGETHRVSVALRQRGLKARHRNTFTDVAPGSEIDLMIEGAQLFGLPLAAEGQLEISTGPPRRSDGRDLLLDVEVTIPLAELQWMPRGDRWSTSLELRIAARDERGEVADVPVIPIELERSGPADSNEVVSETFEIRLRPLAHELVFVLYDPLSRALWSKRIDFSP